MLSTLSSIPGWFQQLHQPLWTLETGCLLCFVLLLLWLVSLSRFPVWMYKDLVRDLNQLRHEQATSTTTLLKLQQQEAKDLMEAMQLKMEERFNLENIDERLENIHLVLKKDGDEIFRANQHVGACTMRLNKLAPQVEDHLRILQDQVKRITDINDTLRQSLSMMSSFSERLAQEQIWRTLVVSSLKFVMSHLGLSASAYYLDNPPFSHVTSPPASSSAAPAATPPPPSASVPTTCSPKASHDTSAPSVARRTGKRPPTLQALASSSFPLCPCMGATPSSDSHSAPTQTESKSAIPSGHAPLSGCGPTPSTP